jgi:hypothetical protein
MLRSSKRVAISFEGRGSLISTEPPSYVLPVRRRLGGPVFSDIHWTATNAAEHGR